MNWEALGSIAEFIGAVAVLVTLVYLATQTRMTRIAAEETSRRASQQGTNAVVEMYSRWRLAVVQGVDLAEIVVKARTETLSEKEQLIFNNYFQELFFAAVTAFTSGSSATSIHRETSDALHLASVLNQNPLAIKEWDRMRPLVANVSNEFVAEVDDLIDHKINS